MASAGGALEEVGGTGFVGAPEGVAMVGGTLEGGVLVDGALEEAEGTG